MAVSKRSFNPLAFIDQVLIIVLRLDKTNRWVIKQSLFRQVTFVYRCLELSLKFLTNFAIGARSPRKR